MKQADAQRRRKLRSIDDTPLGTVSKLREVTRNSGLAYVVLDGTRSAALLDYSDPSSGIGTVQVEKPPTTLNLRKRKAGQGGGSNSKKPKG